MHLPRSRRRAPAYPARARPRARSGRSGGGAWHPCALSPWRSPPRSPARTGRQRRAARKPRDGARTRKYAGKGALRRRAAMVEAHGAERARRRSRCSRELARVIPPQHPFRSVDRRKAGRCPRGAPRSAARGRLDRRSPAPPRPAVGGEPPDRGPRAPARRSGAAPSRARSPDTCPDRSTRRARRRMRRVPANRVATPRRGASLLQRRNRKRRSACRASRDDPGGLRTRRR